MKPSKDSYRKDNTPSKKENTENKSYPKSSYKSQRYPDSKPPVSKPKPKKDKGDDNPGGSRIPSKPKSPKKGPGSMISYHTSTPKSKSNSKG